MESAISAASWPAIAWPDCLRRLDGAERLSRLAASASFPASRRSGTHFINDNMEKKADIAIVGAGILGLAHAYAAARRGRRVVVFERDIRASRASIRNFGLIWPIGQTHGMMHQLALRSRGDWLEILKETKLPFWPTGSLHLVYRDDEAAVAQEF